MHAVREVGAQVVAASAGCNVSGTYNAMVEPYLGPGFSYRELVHEGLQNKQLPPAAMRSRIIRPLQLANELRNRMKSRGARGLLIAAAYRPKGGAAMSQHKFNRALDLDLIPGDYELAQGFVIEAVNMLCVLGANENLRLGIYGRPGSCASIRVHIDTAPGARGWQHYGSKVLTLAQSDIPKVAAKMGLQVPARRTK
jgi:hypothetical protein